MARRSTWVRIALLSAVLGACGVDGSDGGEPSPTTDGARPGREVTVDLQLRPVLVSSPATVDGACADGRAPRPDDGRFLASDGSACYDVGPPFLTGRSLTGAEATLERGAWAVEVSVVDEEADAANRGFNACYEGADMPGRRRRLGRPRPARLRHRRRGRLGAGHTGTGPGLRPVPDPWLLHRDRSEGARSGPRWVTDARPIGEHPTRAPSPARTTPAATGRRRA